MLTSFWPQNRSALNILSGNGQSGIDPLILNTLQLWDLPKRRIQYTIGSLINKHPMRILYSPLTVSKPVFLAFMALVLCFFVFMEFESRQDDIPEIKAAVLRQADSLSRSEESLRSLELGHITRSRYSTYHDGKITGYFQFDGSYSNKSWEIVVDWRKADTNAPIDRIELVCASQEPKIIWPRK